jgi:hypothetical protein
MSEDPNPTDSESPPAAEEARPAAAQADRTVSDLKHQGDKLEEEIESTRTDWERKQEDASVPGAVPAPEGEGKSEDSAGDDEDDAAEDEDAHEDDGAGEGGSGR